MTAVFPEFSVNISQKRWSCVLDPTLALSVFGLPLVTRLGAVMDVWVARELWHILDNTHFYLQQPETLLRTEDGNDSMSPERSEAVVNALREWERIRLENDPARQHCYWIGDGPMESFLPDGQEPEIVWRFEAICAALDRRLADNSALPSAYRDAASLAVSLPAAFVLTHLPQKAASGDGPGICLALDEWGIPCRQISADDPWQIKESEILRQILIQAGLGKWIWMGFRPAVLHLTAPAASTASAFDSGEAGFTDGDLAEFETPGKEPVDQWRDARGFWYPL